VARERDAATQRLWDSLYAALTAAQRAALDALLEVPPGARVSELERWRTGPARASGLQMVKALNRVAEIIGSGLSRVQLDAGVTPRRLAELARYGMGTDVAQLKRHGDQRRMATLVATVTQLEATATDDALELLELLMATELAGRARQEANKETVKRHPRLARASAMLAVVAQVLLEARGTAAPPPSRPPRRAPSPAWLARPGPGDETATPRAGRECPEDLHSVQARAAS
jgi:hypothetical protein